MACPIKKNITSFSGQVISSDVYSAVSNRLNGETSIEFDTLKSILNNNDFISTFLSGRLSKQIDNDILDKIVAIKKKQFDKTTKPSDYTVEEMDIINSISGSLLLKGFNDSTGEMNINLLLELTKDYITSYSSTFGTLLDMSNLYSMYSKLKYGLSSNGGFREDLIVDPLDETQYTDNNGGFFIRASAILDELMGRESTDVYLKKTFERIAKDFESVEKQYLRTGNTKDGYILETKNNNTITYKKVFINGNWIKKDLKQYQEYVKNSKQSSLIQGRLYHAFIENELLINKMTAVLEQEKVDEVKLSIVNKIDNQLKENNKKILEYKKQLNSLDINDSKLNEIESNAKLFITENITSMLPDLYIKQEDVYIPNTKNPTWLQIDTEKTVAINSQYNSNSSTYNGFASTIDIVIAKDYNGKKIYTIIDAKSGESKNNKSNKIKGTKYSNNQHTSNKLKLVLNAMMIKASDPDASIEELILSSIELNKETNEASFKNEDLMPEFSELLSLLKMQFNKNNKDFVDNNQHLFSLDSYFIEPQLLRDKKEDLLKTNFKKYSDEKNMKEELLYFIDSEIKSVSQKIKVSVAGKVNLSNYLSKLIQSKSYITTGKRYISNNSVSFRQRWTTHASQSDNQFVKFFYQSFEKANTALNRFSIKEATSIEKLFNKVFSNQLSVAFVDYNELYEDLFNVIDVESKDPDTEVTNYKSYELKSFASADSWRSFVASNRQKALFADEMRFKIRFQYFKTMAPHDGVKFIKAELDKRLDASNRLEFLDPSHEDLLRKQISDLNSMKPKNLFKEEEYYKYKNIYTEGWFPSYSLSKDSNQSIQKSIHNLKSTGIKESLKDSFVDSLDSWNAEPYINTEDPSILPESGVHVNWFNKKEEVDFDEKYSLNFPQAVFEFMYSMERKNEYDNVYHLGVGIVNMLEAPAIAANENVIGFLKDQLLMNVRGQKRKVFGTVTTVNGTDIDLNTATMALTTLVRWKTMSLNLIGGIASSTSASIILINKAFANYFFNAINGNKSVVNGAYIYDTNDVTFHYLKAVLFDGIVPYVASSIKHIYRSTGSNLSIEEFYKKNNLEDSLKIELLSKEIGFQPDSIQRIIEENTFNIQPIASFKNAQDFSFWSYKVLDTINYNAVLYATLKSMKIKGTEKSMLDAYIVKDGLLVWDENIPARGIDADTGEPIYGLTTKEVQSLKFMTTKFMGSMRPEEKTAMDSNTALSLFSTFKRFIPGILDATLSAENAESSLGYYIETGQVDSDGLPKFKWVSERDKGTLIIGWDLASIGFDKMLSLLGLSRIAVNDKIGFKEYFNNLSKSQQRNLYLLMVNLSSTLTTWGIIMKGFELDDDDEKEIFAGLTQKDLSKFIKKANAGVLNTLNPFLLKEYFNAPVPEILSKMYNNFFGATSEIINEGELSDKRKRSLNESVFFDPLITTKQEQKESEEE